VRSAYRTLARRYHPDAGEGSSVERFRQVVEAYEILNDPAHRRLYDLSLRPSVRRRAVPVEPMVASTGPLVRDAQAQAGMFFRATRPPDWDDLFEEMIRSMDDFFGPRRFRW
jgi:DnaJ-class molecular chaperone